MAWRMRRVRRVREVQQFAQAECGLCCIAMILSAYGSRDSVAGLRREHEVGRDGLTIKQIAAILRGRGFEVRAFRAGVQRLGQLRLPLIAYWDDSHVVVVEEIDEHRVTVVDPGGGFYARTRRRSSPSTTRASRSKPYRRRTTGPNGTASPASGGSSCAR